VAECSLAAGLTLADWWAGDFVLAPANRRVRDTIIDDVTDFLDSLGLDSLHYLSKLAAPRRGESGLTGPDELARRALAPLQMAWRASRGEATGGDTLQDPPPETVRALVEQLTRISSGGSQVSSGGSLSNVASASASASWAQRGAPMVQQLALATLDRPEVFPRPLCVSRWPCAARAPCMLFARSCRTRLACTGADWAACFFTQFPVSPIQDWRAGLAITGVPVVSRGSIACCCVRHAAGGPASS
jgi:hypothetical protein